MREENISVMIFLIILFSSVKASLHQVYPEQIHLSIGDCPLDMVITWVTFSSTKDSFVWFGELNDGLTYKAEGYSKMFISPGKFRSIRYIHRVTLSNLSPQTFYVYRCGSCRGMSEAHIFKTPPDGSDWSPKLIIYGDMGWKGAAVFPYVVRETNDFEVDAVVHVGDIAYNMDSYDGIVGDEFLRMIEPVASSVPYMTTVGNHEQAFNFSYYKNKFSMPGCSKGLFYSFDLGPAHFIAISTEVYYFTEYGLEQIVNQYNWLLNDLKTASETKNRFERPWIIVFAHRPMYCSSDTGEDCSLEMNILKSCSLNSCDYGLEDLFHQYKVDLTFSGHMHYYERTWPIYNNEVYNGSCDEPYRNAGACVHIITGAAGMKTGTETVSCVRRDWFAFFSCENTYTVLTICNKTHLYLEQKSANRKGEVIDSVWLVKDYIYTSD